MIAGLAHLGLGFGYDLPDLPDDGLGNITNLERTIATRLGQITIDDTAVFRTAAQWNHQISVSEGGVEAFGKYAPFAFVAYKPSRGDREGDGDLCQVLNFEISIGTESKSIGVARIGSSTVLGISKLRDLVIAALDDWHPGEGFDCDPIYYEDDDIKVETPYRHAIIMTFTTNLIGDQT